MIYATAQNKVILNSLMALQNANPVVYERAKERELTCDEKDEQIVDKIDEREIFDILFFNV